MKSINFHPNATNFIYWLYVLNGPMIGITIVKDSISIRKYINKFKIIYFWNMSTIGYP